jgi:hypothetical protein
MLFVLIENVDAGLPGLTVAILRIVFEAVKKAPGANIYKAFCLQVILQLLHFNPGTLTLISAEVPLAHLLKEVMLSESHFKHDWEIQRIILGLVAVLRCREQLLSCGKTIEELGPFLVRLVDKLVKTREEKDSAFETDSEEEGGGEQDIERQLE